MSDKNLILKEQMAIFKFLKRQFKRIREDMIDMCKGCVKKGHADCVAGEYNHCKVRQCYIELTQLLSDEG